MPSTAGLRRACHRCRQCLAKGACASAAGLTDRLILWSELRRAHQRPLPGTVGHANRVCSKAMCGDGAPHLPGVGQPQTGTANVRGRRPAPTGGWTNRKPRRPMCGDGAPHLPGVGQPQTATANVRGRFPAPTGGWIAANRDGRCAGTVPRTCRGLDKPQTATNHSKKIKQ